MSSEGYEGASREALGDENAGSDGSHRALLPRRNVVAVIGIDTYAHLPRLHCAVSDALGVQRLFVEQLGFEAPIPPLKDKEATKAAIESLIEDGLRTKLVGCDALVLFFAGHGTARTAVFGGKEVVTGYLAPVEATADQFGGHLGLNSLLEKVALLPPRHILVILDACHSGIALGNAAPAYRSMDQFVAALTSRVSRRVITSARSDQVAVDSGPVADHSLFTGALIEAIRNGDAQSQGVLTSSALALLLQQRVGQASGSRQTPDYGAFAHDDRGELVLVAPAGGSSSEVPAAAVAPASVAPPVPTAERPDSPSPEGRWWAQGARLVVWLAPLIIALVGLAVWLLFRAIKPAPTDAPPAPRFNVAVVSVCEDLKEGCKEPSVPRAVASQRVFLKLVSAEDMPSQITDEDGKITFDALVPRAMTTVDRSPYRKFEGEVERGETVTLCWREDVCYLEGDVVLTVDETTLEWWQVFPLSLDKPIRRAHGRTTIGSVKEARAYWFELRFPSGATPPPTSVRLKLADTTHHSCEQNLTGLGSDQLMKTWVLPRTSCTTPCAQPEARCNPGPSEPQKLRSRPWSSIPGTGSGGLPPREGPR